MKVPPPTTIIIKPTNACNAACVYCYEDNEAAAHQHIIPDLAVRRIFSWARESELAKVQLVWHGGEPLLAGRDFFARVIRAAERAARPGLEFMHSLQTNGTMVDARWCEFFLEHDFGVGISLDGPAAIHDGQRPLTAGRGSHSRAVRALFLMTSSGLKVSASCVVTRQSIQRAREIVRFFDTLPIGSVDFLPMSSLADHLNCHPLLVTPDEYTEFLREALDEWTSLERPGFDIRYFENLMRGLCGSSPSLCTFSGRCGDYVSVDHDGSVYPCDSFMRFPEFRLGSVLDEPLDAVLNRATYQQFRSDVGQAPENCASCSTWEICHGGCPFERYSRTGSLSGQYPFCGTRLAMAGEVGDLVRRLGAAELLRRPEKA